MKRMLMLVLLLAACPNPETGKVDPWLTARTIINGANVSLVLADGIFGQWLSTQTDPVKVKESQTRYQQVRTAVANGLQLALNGVDLAQTAKEAPDVQKLLAQANSAWAALTKLLGDLLGSGDHGIVLAVADGTASQPASQPVGVKRSAVTVKRSPLQALPKKLGGGS